MKQGLIEKIRTEYPQFRTIDGKKFAWRPPRTIVVGPEQEGEELLLLHELGHALLGHRDFNSDAERLKMEVAAWSKAEELAARYGVEWDEDQAQEELDTYREWLHRRSLCPRCGLTRYQTPDGVYHCPRCENLA